MDVSNSNDDKKTKVGLISIEALEAECDSFAEKLKNELRKAHTRVKDLVKELSAKEEDFSSALKQREDRCNSLSVETKLLREENVQLKNEIKQSEQNYSKERCYFMDMIEENKKHIESLNDHIKSMNTKLKELNCEHSKETEQLKFDLNEVKHSLTTKCNEDRIRKQEIEYKMHRLEDENVKYCESIKNLKAEVTTLKSSLNQLQTSDYKDDIEKLHVRLSEMKTQKTKDDYQHQEEVKQLQTLLSEERKNFYDLSFQYDHLTHQNQTFSEKLKQVNQEKQELLLRLSKLDDAYSPWNNPNLVYLFDDKTPTKLAEEFSEVYDNEWTDAFEDELIEDERQKCNILLGLLKHANQLCYDLSTDHMTRIQQSLCTLTFHNTMAYVERKTGVYIKGANGRTTDIDVIHVGVNDVGMTKEVSDEVPGRRLASVSAELRDAETTTEVYDEVPGRLAYVEPESSVVEEVEKEENVKEIRLESHFEKLLPKEQKKIIMDAKKLVEKHLSEEVEKAVTGLIVQVHGIDTEKQDTVVDYIKKCVNICWSMHRNVPPVFVEFPDITENIVFDTNKFKPYTKSGKHIDYIVWPAVYLHEGGPLLCKGVAQGRKE